MARMDTDWLAYITDVQSDDEVMDHAGSDSEGSQSPKAQDGQESDDDGHVDTGHAPGTISEKKRAQNEVFAAFAATSTAESTAKEVRESIRNATDDDLSIRNILAKQENSASITNPRDYQTELFRKAKDENIIAVLDTGSGKTHIATLLLRHILDVELEDRAKGKPPKIAFFLVHSVNLVFQQTNVLQCGLDHQVEGICGAMGSSLWQKSTWVRHFERNMVIVCTPEVLFQCMMHSFITMSQVNLLIFDEAHHAKNNHPYARLIKDYYLHEADLSKRPRIFGMTASPVDANVDISQAARDLEILLHCKIATTSDLSLLSNHIKKPEEKFAMYSRLKPRFETSFHQHMKTRYGHVKSFSKFFDDSKIFSSELGRWASDMYWTFSFSEDESRKIQQREERIHNKEKLNTVDKLNADIAQLNEAADYVRQYDFGTLSTTLEDLSSKVLQLHHWLNLYYERTDEARCIVFVERRQTARLLRLIFSHIGGPNLRSDVLMGNSSTIGDMKVTLRTQFLTVAKFRKGEINCLFATSVAEEGLDIPQCNLVVRFDLYRTMIAYVQSRGRARHRNSTYLHMIETDNALQRTVVHNALNAEKVMRNFCNGLSSDRLLNEVDDAATWLLANEEDFPTYTDPDSKAKLTYRSSLSVVDYFVATLPVANQEVNLQPTYVTTFADGRFLCEVILPDCSPIISIRGHPQKKKTIAKCSAAFEMCLELRRKGFLDQHLLPTTMKKLPAMRNALLAISGKKKNLYDMRIKPSFWDDGFGTTPDRLYLTIVDVSAGLDRPHQPLGLITRAPFPQMPEFPVYLTDGRPSAVVTTPLAIPIKVTDENLKLFTTLTLQIYQDIFAKTFEYDVAKMSYWLVPIQSDKTSSIGPHTDPESIIDWDQVNEACRSPEYRWTSAMSNDFLKDKYIVDPNDGGRRFYSIGVAPNLKADDPVPNTAPRYKYMDSILEYSISLWAKSRVKWKDVWDHSQPVLEVEKIPFRRNHLARVEQDEDEVKTNMMTFVCPQPMRISTLTPPFVAMCFMFPAAIHRYEAYMTAMDACNVLGLDIGPRLALEALTKDSENTDEHDEEKINFKSGMGPNYERLEFMGDCFLKMATSIATFVQQPNENEFEFHVRRMVMLCNKNLFEKSMKYRLYEYVRTMAFSRRTWYPEGLKLTKGKGANRTGPQELKHSLGEKTIADVCEAFIGAAFMQHNEYGKWDPEKWDQAVKAVKVLVDSEDHVMEKWSDYYGGYTKPDYQLAQATASQLDLAAKVEKKHPYHFKYPRLLRSAFVHPSQAFMWENVPNYQRLEFLGDSLLDQVFITHLFYRFPDKDPQWLTEHKMPMVSNKFLAAVCVKLGFHTHIRQNNAMLSSQIRNYVDEVEEAEHNAKGSLDYWNNTHTEPPKCLADVIEAYVAAIFVDSEFDFSVVQDFFDMHLAPFFDDITLYDNWAKNNPITRLNRLLNIGFGCRNWRLQCMAQPSVIPGVKDRVVAMVQIHYKVWFHGTADSNRYASPKVCHAALEKLEGLPPFEFRKQYGCDCEDDDEDVVMEDAELEDKVEEAVQGADGILNGGPNGKAGLQGPDNAHVDDYLEERLNKAIVELGKEDDDD